MSPSSAPAISYIGYTTVEVDINPSKTFYAITLEEDNQMLDEVVVVGFGTQKKVNLTGAVATVNSDKLESRPVTSVGQALQGVPAVSWMPILPSISVVRVTWGRVPVLPRWCSLTVSPET